MLFLLFRLYDMQCPVKIDTVRRGSQIFSTAKTKRKYHIIRYKITKLQTSIAKKKNFEDMPDIPGDHHYIVLRSIHQKTKKNMPLLELCR